MSIFNESEFFILPAAETRLRGWVQQKHNMKLMFHSETERGRMRKAVLHDPCSEGGYGREGSAGWGGGRREVGHMCHYRNQGWTLHAHTHTHTHSSVSKCSKQSTYHFAHVQMFILVILEVERTHFYLKLHELCIVREWTLIG